MVGGRHSVAALTPGKKPGNIYTGSCVDLGVGVTYFHYFSYQEQSRIKGRSSREQPQYANEQAALCPH